jgi:ubiquinone/menaquinone biosynthesis C-methylase UbiE
VSDIETIAEAFSRTAAKYDAMVDNNPHLSRLREKVYGHVSRHVKAGGRILELNAGSGIDAVSLAQRGYTIHATDISPNMLERSRKKVETLHLQGQVTVQECSYERLDLVEGSPYDAVLSNFGGLNCIPNLSTVIEQLPLVLRPGGTITWVLMPPVCLWEMAEMLRGKFRLAFRRLNRYGVRSHLEGLYFNVYYFSPAKVVGWFGADYQKLALEGLSVITPISHNKSLALRHPQIYSRLAWLDDRLSSHSPWSGWGDFYILTMQYKPGGV